MDFTPEQRDAIDIHDRHLIVTAGAGSGKTRVLVERFLALLDRYPDWTLPGIVAITFTEKAATEMRSRVRQAIEARIADAVRTGEGLDRWLDHQAALTRARIGTIHALCAHVLRANPAQAGVDPAFDVLDENDAAILRDDAVEEALARLAVEDRPGAALLAVYDVADVRRVMQAFAGFGPAAAIRDWLATPPGELMDRWRALWADSMQAAQQSARADADLNAALRFIEVRDLPPGDKLSDVWRAVLDQRAALLGDDPGGWLSAVDVLASAIKVNVGAASKWGGKELLAESKDALKLIRERARALQADLLPEPGERDHAALDWLACWGDAITLAADVYGQRKRERTVLDFDDLETRAQRLLDDHPDVAARYHAEFRHVLIDEFQDTNEDQRRIAYRLAGVGLPGMDGRLFVVGDPKQSIYAFRGADVSVFGDVRADLTARGGLELPLSTSFRTHDRLVRAFNDLFGRILGAGDGRYEVALGQPMAADRPSEAWHDQPLTVFAFPRPDRDLYPDFNVDALRRWEAWTLAGHIRDRVERGALVWDKKEDTYRAMTYGDVAILFQATTQLPLYESVFKAADLPYVTFSGKGYYDRQEVWDLLNLLRALHNPADDLALASVLRAPLFGLSDDGLFALRLARDDAGLVPLWGALFDPALTPLFPAEDAAARAFACDVLAELRDLAGRAPVAAVLTRALTLTGTLATLTGLPDGARRRGNVEKLIALARESGRVALGAFLAYARDLTAREVREGEAVVEAGNAVQLMSVHASKGLEFPVVVLADASWSRRRWGGARFTFDAAVGAACRLPTDDPDSDAPESFAWEYAAQLDERRDRAERRRLLYVGATRAQDHLIVSGTLHRCADHAWLRQWLRALGVDDAPDPSDDPVMLAYAWGTCALHVPLTVTLPDHAGARRAADVSGWDDPDVARAQPIAGVTPHLPPLLADVPADPYAPARVLTATQIARLGHVPFYDPTASGRAAFRHSVLFDAPEPVRPLPVRAVDDWGLRRCVGQIVHRALQAWLLPGDAASEDEITRVVARLETYAWEQQLSDPAQVHAAVTQALDLLRRFETSRARAEIDRAAQVYRELPFVHTLDGRTIHGVIDVLYFDGREWTVLDYKTTLVRHDQAEDNAKRYYLQVGVYARAVEALTGQTPHTHLYYIYPGWRVIVKPDAWRPALDRLEDDLMAALADDR